MVKRARRWYGFLTTPRRCGRSWRRYCRLPSGFAGRPAEHWRTPNGAPTLPSLIDKALDGFDREERIRVSVKDLKQRVGGVSGSEAAKKAFTRAIDEVLRYRNDWRKDGRSLKRVTAEDLFPDAEPS
jgi:hypothetical protein